MGDTLDAVVVWQDSIFNALAISYGLVSFFALVQLVRIQLRVPKYRPSTQKVFYFLNFLVTGVRCLVFTFRREVQQLHPEIIQHVFIDVTSLGFFTTYAVLVLFWAERYYQAREVSSDGLRRAFYIIDAVVYAIQIGLWLILWWKPLPVLVILPKLFLAVVSLCVALGFLFHGGSVIPVGQIKRTAEEAFTGWLCHHKNSMCFLIRCIMLCVNAFDQAADFDVLDHPLLNLTYYMLVEILPCSLVLFILRKLPPKRSELKDD